MDPRLTKRGSHPASKTFSPPNSESFVSAADNEARKIRKDVKNLAKNIKILCSEIRFFTLKILIE
jgi:hypothetical protein